MSLSITDQERHNLLDEVAEVQAEVIKVGHYLSLRTALGDAGAAIHAAMLVRQAEAMLESLRNKAGG